jgi:GT2 family glycosyltransferase
VVAKLGFNSLAYLSHLADAMVSSRSWHVSCSGRFELNVGGGATGQGLKMQDSRSCVAESADSGLGGSLAAINIDAPGELRSGPERMQCSRIRSVGKFFRLGNSKWFLKGLTYGPFAPNSAGQFFAERAQTRRDFSQIRQMGANCIRLYHLPPVWLLDDALEHGLRVLVDVPWEKHRCFFEDWASRDLARRTVRQAAKELGGHPALFAISVANEFPNDIVRFYGVTRVERFVNELMDIVKQEAPQCLTTFANYPSTEFLNPSNGDFCCYNVYLDDAQRLGAYLERLQHIAGARPLILGEYGLDSLRRGEAEQARAIAQHIQKVSAHGLAGSFVFSYTDDWFTGGHRIEDWAFGMTNRNRVAKPAFASLSQAWSGALDTRTRTLPSVSVVVCSYNGARTLDECLRSLGRLDYPSYEVILVDDGSTDGTSEIAGRFPDIKYIHQPNLGLSVARNVGAQASSGDVVAYTDSDCVADEHWLFHLVTAMLGQSADAIGGPNLPPPTDSWTAQCVAASPGGPSHVMLDDRRAEHVPGCNMAFRRDTLLALGGFDSQFRQAGDDVDICWRFLDAGKTIGYAPSAVVWHHRRNTVKAYLRQQKGYGRSEAMLHFKHPQRFNLLGCSRWQGIIYGEGAVGLPTLPPAIYHGRLGAAPFQTIYRQNRYSVWAYFTLLEWHAIAAFVAILAILLWPILAVSAGMGCLSLLAAFHSARAARLPRGAPLWCRALIFLLHLCQPVVRAWHRYAYRLANKSLRSCVVHEAAFKAQVKNVSIARRDLYWTSSDALGREQLLQTILEKARLADWSGDFNAEWASWDLFLTGDLWHDLTVHTVSEELGWPDRFTRARCSVQLTPFALVVASGDLLWTAVALGSGKRWGIVTALGATLLLLGMMLVSRRRCLTAVTKLVWRAGRQAKLKPVYLSETPLLEPAAKERAAGGSNRGVEWETETV